MAIYAQRGASFEATAEGFNSGLVGTLGVRIVDNIGGVTLPRTISGISELVANSGVYAVELIAPSTAGEYTIVWDDGLTGPDHAAAESLTVLQNTTIQVASGTSGMSYGDILDDVLGNPLRFEASMRARAGRAINLRYAHLWGLEDWTFRFALATVAVTSGNEILQGVPDDFGTPAYLWRDDGQKLVYLEQARFQYRYLPEIVGTPQDWTVVAGEAILGPTPQTTATYTTYYRRRLTAMVDEASYPMIPPEYHLMLVHGGRAELLAVSDDPMAPVMEQQWQADIEAMRREYLIDVLGQPDFWPPDYWAVTGQPEDG